MLPFAGAVVVWSGKTPRLETHRIPRAGFTFGREHADAEDSRISAEHVRLSAVVDKTITVEDAASRNGTFVNGERIARAEQCGLPAIVRVGYTIFVLVEDVRRYEGVTLARRGTLACGASLAGACSIVDIAAHAEEHLGIFGPLHVGRALAHHYADTVGGERVVAKLDVISLATLVEKLAGKTPRTMILELDRPLTHPDQPELEAWLETDVRIVSIAHTLDSFKFMPRALTRRMTPRAVELPQFRFDEIATTFVDTLAERTATAHPTLIEAALLQLRNMNEETLLRYIDATAKRCVESGRAEVRGSDLHEYIEADAFMRNCHVGTPRR